jgi:hypothetical protein
MKTKPMEEETLFDELRELSFPSLCLAESKKPLNALELKAIASLIAYVSATQSADVETVLSVLTTAFNVADVKSLPQSRYDEALRFLMRVDLKALMN